jgi:hypothetical protein
MTRARLAGSLSLLLCGVISVLWGFALSSSPSDFKGVYYGTRCLLEHNDPYHDGAPLSVYQADGGERPEPSNPDFQILTRQVYLPTAFVFTAPFAMLPWGPAHLLWMVLSAGSLTFAAFLMWNLAADYSPGVSLFLICILLANSEILFSSGNPAAIAVSLCVVAAWCFLRERFVAAGVLCFVLSLAIKPHDAGVVWLYFLLAGGASRKRALQALVVTAVLSVPAFLWVTHIAPHWMQELHSNLLMFEGPGGLNDPGPTSYTSHGPAMVIDLQAAFSVFRNDSSFYNPASFLVCGALLLVWLVATLRSQSSPARAMLALAVSAVLTMLVTYHRPYDAKLLLLTVPACAMLWAEGGPTGRLALLLNSLGIVFTSDIPLALLVMLTKNRHISTAGLPGKILTVLLIRPVPFILLSLGIFYLVIYVRRTSGKAAKAEARV